MFVEKLYGAQESSKIFEKTKLEEKIPKHLSASRFLPPLDFNVFPLKAISVRSYQLHRR